MVWNEQLKRDIPEKWNAIKLGAFIKLDDSKRIPLSTYEREKRKGVYPYYGATGIMDYIDDYLFDDELILLAEDGSTSDSKGFPIVQYVWGKVWVNNHAHIIYPRNLSHKVYTYIMLKTIPVKLIETGSIQKKINQDNLLSYNIIDVPTSILDEFTKIVTPIWKKKMIVDEEINALIKQRDELLPLLMNGQVNSDLSLQLFQLMLFFMEILGGFAPSSLCGAQARPETRGSGFVTNFPKIVTKLPFL